MALFPDASGKKLKGVTWVDPLTVEDIEPDTPLRSSVDKGSSSIHGTNDRMIQLPGTSELLGKHKLHFHFNSRGYFVKHVVLLHTNFYSTPYMF